MMAAGGVASLRTLARGQPAREADRTVSIVVDGEDLHAVSIRAAVPLGDLLCRLKSSGATHVALTERTLDRLLRSGDLFPTVPREPLAEPAPFGHWLYFAGADERLLAQTLVELQTRFPHLRPQAMRAERGAFAVAGDPSCISAVGLGFDDDLAAEIHRAGLLVVPRPVSYDWHEPALIARSIAHAARAGDGVVAFEGNLILGHELHLDETLAGLERHDLTFAYFAQSRHQRGDWFIAKRRMPHVVNAHQFTPAQMIPEDYHSISHRWANLARERGVRMCFVNFFRVVHATEPLDCLRYLEHVRGALEAKGFVLDRGDKQVARRTSCGVAPTTASALVPVAAGALAAREWLGLGEGATLLLGAGGMACAATGIARLDRARDALEQQYPPAYASKLLALGTTVLAPLTVALLARGQRSVLAALALDGLIAASSSAALAALTASDEYRLRVEEYKGFDFDLFVPLAGALLSLPDISMRDRVRMAFGLALGWILTRRLAPDPLALLDLSPSEGHSHHLSAAMRLAGDSALKVGPRPIRKWAGLAPFALALYVAARRKRRQPLAVAALAASLAGHAALYTGLRRPERDPAVTARDAARSWLVGLALGVLGTIIVDSPLV